MKTMRSADVGGGEPRTTSSAEVSKSMLCISKMGGGVVRRERRIQ